MISLGNCFSFKKINLIFRGFCFFIKQKEETPTSNQKIEQTEIKYVALPNTETKYIKTHVANCPNELNTEEFFNKKAEHFSSIINYKVQNSIKWKYEEASF